MTFTLPGVSPAKEDHSFSGRFAAPGMCPVWKYSFFLTSMMLMFFASVYHFVELGWACSEVHFGFEILFSFFRAYESHGIALSNERFIYHISNDFGSLSCGHSKLSAVRNYYAFLC